MLTAELATRVREVARVLRAAATSYSRHSGRMLASAVAFSALLSIAPLLYVALGIASVAVGEGTSRASVMHDIGRWLGPEGAEAVAALLDRAGTHTNSLGATVMGGLVVAYASTRLFSQMKGTLDHLWDIHPRPGGPLRANIGKQLRKRGLALLLVVFVGVLIVGVVLVKTVLAASAEQLGETGGHVLWRVGDTAVSLATTTLMFAAIFKALPDAKLTWRDAVRGAVVTGVLFTLGATLIGLYLGHESITTHYGPGGSIVLILLWVHYSAQVFFFGAAVTGELARRNGRPIEPDADGMRVTITEIDPA